MLSNDVISTVSATRVVAPHIPPRQGLREYQYPLIREANTDSNALSIHLGGEKQPKKSGTPTADCEGVMRQYQVKPKDLKQFIVSIRAGGDKSSPGKICVGGKSAGLVCQGRNTEWQKLHADANPSPKSKGPLCIRARRELRCRRARERNATVRPTPSCSIAATPASSNLRSAADSQQLIIASLGSSIASRAERARPQSARAGSSIVGRGEQARPQSARAGSSSVVSRRQSPPSTTGGTPLPSRPTSAGGVWQTTPPATSWWNTHAKAMDVGALPSGSRPMSCSGPRR